MFCHLSRDLARVFLTNMAQARVAACILSTVDRHKTSYLPTELCAEDGPGIGTETCWVFYLYMTLLWNIFNNISGVLM
jgi:hypothetical protein